MDGRGLAAALPCRADGPAWLAPLALAGQGAALVRQAAAADLVATLVAKTEDVISRLDADPSG